MALTAYCSEFDTPTATGEQTYTASGTPLAVLQFGPRAADDAGGSWFWNFGFGEFTNGGAASGSSQHNASVQKHRHSGQANTLTRMYITASLEQVADAVNAAADQFGLNYTTSISRNWRCFYLALAGSDLTNRLVGSITVPTSTGNQTVTTGFQPDIVILVSSGGTTASNRAKTMGVLTPDASWTAGLGVGLNTFTKSRVFEAGAALKVVDSDGTVLARCTYVSRSATGFTINWSTAPATGFPVYYLAMAGGQWKVGTFAKSDNTSTPVSQSITGIGFTPVAALFGSSMGTNSDGTVDTGSAQAAMGTADGTREGSYFSTATDNGSTSSNYERSTVGKAIVLGDTGAATILAAADCAFSSDQIDLTWTTNDARATVIGYIAVGANAAPVHLAATWGIAAGWSGAARKVARPGVSIAAVAGVAAPVRKVAHPSVAIDAAAAVSAAPRKVAHPAVTVGAEAGWSAALRKLARPLVSLAAAAGWSASARKVAHPAVTVGAVSAWLAAVRKRAHLSATVGATSGWSAAARKVAHPTATIAAVAGWTVNLAGAVHVQVAWAAQAGVSAAARKLAHAAASIGATSTVTAAARKVAHPAVTVAASSGWSVSARLRAHVSVLIEVVAGWLVSLGDRLAGGTCAVTVGPAGGVAVQIAAAGGLAVRLAPAGGVAVTVGPEDAS